MVVGRIINKFINIFTGLFGIATVVIMLIIYINNALPVSFLGETAITLGHLKNYFTLATVFCAGLEFTLKRNVILAIVFAAILVGAGAFMLYTDFGLLR
ncbi:MAG: hypothetical protein K2O04_05815 [Clostridiales bacterium]|nr:hypothetical protein [Clostridiales bacterium]